MGDGRGRTGGGNRRNKSMTSMTSEKSKGRGYFDSRGKCGGGGEVGRRVERRQGLGLAQGVFSLFWRERGAQIEPDRAR